MKMSKSAREMISELMRAGYSQAKIAKLCGVSTAALNAYLKGSYAAKDLSQIEKKIMSGCKTEIERLQKNFESVLPFQPNTETAEIVLSVAHLCHTSRRMGLIYGAAGVGKTRACLEYCARNKNAVYIEARPSFTARTLMKNLAEKLGCTPKSNQYELEEEVIRKLRNSGNLVIVDECEHLNHRALETLRTVVFNAAHTGLLLVGLETLKYALIGTRTKNEYLSSRCLVNSRVKALSEDETASLIERFFPGASTAIKKAFFEGTKGNMRLLENTIFNVRELTELNPDVSFTAKLVQAAIAQAVLA